MHNTTNEDEVIPKKVRWMMTFINRVGFPIVAFLLMFYICYVTLEKITKAIQENTISLNLFRSEMVNDHKSMLDHLKYVVKDRHSG